LVKVCDKSAAGFRRFCDLPTTENDVISEKETKILQVDLYDDHKIYDNMVVVDYYGRPME